ncbi:MAG: PqqD family protein [Acidobacteriia bacterium]|nr:PqqD family protein [Terriglobia bacterium]
MMTLSPDTYLVATSGHLSCELDADTVILHLDSGLYYGLNEVGTTLWRLLQQPRRIDDLCDAIVAEYDVDCATCQRDVEAVLQRLTQAGLVEVRREAAQ